ncbi:MAG: Ni/Fe-hydrogenase, b-type cytochrome subunit [Nitrospinae bacterium]|nr:Ni/Fe-hydrogenase, b-type cytochrome subunit [Nitrospinota bacterium]
MSTVSSGANDVGGVYLVVRTRSILACILHWVLFLSVVTLVLSGLYVGAPQFFYGRGEAYQAFSMADARYYHFLAAMFMIAAVAGRFYLAFTESCNRDIMQFMPTRKNIVAAVKLAIYFITLRGQHAHYRFVNPLGGIGIFSMATIFVIQIVTGLTLYSHGADALPWGWLSRSWVESLLGGTQNIRMIHHVAMYILIFFVMIHVYMQIWKTSMFAEGDIVSIIGGYKVFNQKDIGHFADIYGLRREEQPPTVEEMAKASVPMEEGPGQWEGLETPRGKHHHQSGETPAEKQES